MTTQNEETMSHEPTAAPATLATPANSVGDSTPAVVVQNVGKVFDGQKGAQVIALEDINLTVARGEFVSLIGPSGCGKSTLMRLIADLDQPTSGELTVFGKSASQARLDQDYGIAFQQAGLLPWRTVRQNIELPLQLHKVGKEARARRSTDLLKLVGLVDFADNFPDQLSGGMQQRVAIARSLAESPNLLLMDEPFGALDEMTREHMQAELAHICAETGAAVVFVTHSIPEAVFLANRVVVLSPRPGRIRAIVDVTMGGANERTDNIRESEEFFASVSEVREHLHGSSGASPLGVDNR